eukprot:11160206-Lingulodinium_polyedra.AAC.1
MTNRHCRRTRRHAALAATGAGHPIGQPNAATVWRNCRNHRRRCRRATSAATHVAPNPIATGPRRRQTM